jgi:hypothetical protein
MSKPITQLTVKEFMQLESASGLLLLGSALFALAGYLILHLALPKAEQGTAS